LTKEFFQVTDIPTVLSFKERFAMTGTEVIGAADALGRVLAEEISAPNDIPGFDRSTMDGFAVRAASTFGASEGNPAYLNVVGAVRMGQAAACAVGPGEAARIATGGMLPAGADSVIMIEHTDVIDDTTIEAYRSVTPGQNVVAGDEDAARGAVLLTPGCRLRPQELGVLAACGVQTVSVFRRPRVGIISSGDEVVAPDAVPQPGQIRDVNGYTLAGLVRLAGGEPCPLGIVSDRYDDLLTRCRSALENTDLVLVSGGSSVGTRDLTLDVLSALPESRILVHGVSIRPGKPAILAQCGTKAFWGLPGHVTSAMVVFIILVKPFLAWIGGQKSITRTYVNARLSRNLASAQGRVDFVRVRLVETSGELWAEPILGGSGLIRTMVEADGLLAVDLNSEGLDQGTRVDVMLF
jgi:molybdopterin molybdotransferase